LFGNSRAGKVVIGMDETDLPLRSGASCVAEIRPWPGKVLLPCLSQLLPHHGVVYSPTDWKKQMRGKPG
jgi:hypothetical protein